MEQQPKLRAYYTRWTARTVLNDVQPATMVADLPENYKKYNDAFQFIKDVPCDWSQSIYLEAEPADYITVARQDKNSMIGTLEESAMRTDTRVF